MFIPLWVLTLILGLLIGFGIVVVIAFVGARNKRV